MKVYIEAALLTKEEVKYLFLSNLFKFLNLSIFKFISAAGNIPTSERTEYLPPIKFLCSIISALNLFPIFAKSLSFNSVIITNLFFNKYLCLKNLHKLAPRMGS